MILYVSLNIKLEDGTFPKYNCTFTLVNVDLRTIVSIASSHSWVGDETQLLFHLDWSYFFVIMLQPREEINSNLEQVI